MSTKETFFQKIYIKHFKQNKKIWYYTAAVLVIVLILNILLTGTISNSTIYGKDLMNGIKQNSVQESEPDDRFIQAFADFSVDLFRNSYQKGENALISPLSVYTALAMTTNGAAGETRKEFEDILGNGIDIKELNRYINTLVNSLYCKEESFIKINNSIWINTNIGKIEKSFLQTNADYYGAGAFQTDFSKTEESMNRMNLWMKDQTNGMIKDIVTEIDPYNIISLLNTVLFDADWEKAYTNTFEDIFFTDETNGTLVEFMKRELQYIANDRATGFINPYKGNYSFVAILPDLNISIEEYIDSLTGEEFLNLIDLDSSKTCTSVLPKFKYEFEIELKEPLMNMGLQQAFTEQADFSNIHKTLINGKASVKQVSHKTYIDLDEKGTRAAAGTVVTLKERGTAEGKYYVELNRPFIYAIIDNNTKIPVFLGVVNHIDGESASGIRRKGEYLVEDGDFIYRVSDMNPIPRVSVHKYIGTEKNVEVPAMYDGIFVNYIDEYAFEGNKFIEAVTLPLSIIYIYDYAFANCPYLKNLYLYNNYYHTFNDEMIYTKCEGSPNVTVHLEKRPPE